MSYYNFNDHFWKPETVCQQALQPKPSQKNTRKNKVRIILYIICVAIWTPVLFQVLFIATNQNQQTALLDVENSKGNCLTLRHDKGVKIYCSIAQ
ncbi:hypothetical protein [Halotia branconii]|uniref:Uncharacterized protein n=1 Tax=Halotia branconii CENA392 TaxID=1539056 RepID=A0AAJ6NWT2_9CYAN|nr:hypothetical protein [Halotia branconii]WGV27936.1 hypothetical protein QI031_10825 [Halotia branconii CENA392]